MNYLSHGHEVLDDPWMLAGTAAPDWLRAARRRSRLAGAALPTEQDLPQDEDHAQRLSLLRGIRKHIADDLTFHASAEFEQANAHVAALIRAEHPTVRRTGFVAHILIEIMLDAWLMKRDPTLADRYYAALDRLDLDRLSAWINGWASEPAPRFANWVEGFRRIQFLRTYRDDAEVVARLEGVARRVSLPALPPGFERTAHAVRLWVAPRATTLLALR